MSFPDALLQLDSYPDASPPAAVDQAVDFISAVGGRLSVLALNVEIPLRTNALAERLVNLSGLVAEQETASLEACRALVERFTARAEAAKVLGDVVLAGADLYVLPDEVVRRARTRDLCLVPVVDRFDGQIETIQALIFRSGRPVLVFRPGVADLPARPLGLVAVAWDGSRAAARAMADAMPLLVRAREVRVVTLLGEKPEAGPGLAAEAVRHLKAHGVAAAPVEVPTDRARIGDALDSWVAHARPDLLVMGAYGHSRAREFVLGGATEHVLSAPKVPLFLAH
jgi:nucleotide-binding universal stress UspA family protein